MNKKKLVAVVTIVLYLLVMLFPTIPLIVLGIDIKSLSLTVRIIYSASIEFILMLFIIYLHRDDLIKMWKDFKSKYVTYFKKYAFYWVKLIGAMVLANIVVSMISGSISSANEENIRQILKVAPLYIVFSAVIYAPIVEELVFRKSIKDLINNKWLFILASGLSFGLIHCLDSASLLEYLYIIPYAIPGFIFAYILYDSDNIFNTMSMHLFHNTVMIILEIIVLGIL